MQTLVSDHASSSFSNSGLTSEDHTPSSPQSIQQEANYAGIISSCSKMQRVFGMIDKVASTDVTVLILGETGTGKELVARAVHKTSGRTGAMVPVNCGAIPEDILESELFGHEKGAFTGAVSSRIGRFQMADRGTIFLDEIGEMSPKLQVKLLRVLQERCVEPVGSTRSIDVDVRVIAATNKDLREEVKAGRFREDLYYRLQVVPMNLPPLREREQDLTLLSEHFLRRACNNLGRTPLRFSPEVEQRMRDYSWPGNVRELENLIERLAVLADDDTLRPSDLPHHIGKDGGSCRIIETLEEMPAEGLDFNDLVNSYENQLITLALNKTNGNKKAAAKLLHLNRTTLVEKIKKKGLDQKVEVITVEEDTLFSA